MALFKAPVFILVSSLIIMILPEFSFAQCSADVGKTYGCRSGIACFRKNARTGSGVWQCQAGTAPPSSSVVSLSPSSSPSPSSTRPSSSSVKSTPKKPAVKQATSKTKSEVKISDKKTTSPEGNVTAEQSVPIAESDFNDFDDILENVNCDVGYHPEATRDNNFYLPELGDVGVASLAQGGTVFCRHDSVTDAQVAEAMARKKNPGGAEEVADNGLCEQQFQFVQQACFAKAGEAATDCDQENEGIQTAMNATKAVGAGSAVSVQMACSKLGEISKIANGAFGTWKTYCSATQGSCVSTCQQAKALYEQQGCIASANKPKYDSVYVTVKENINKCLDYKKDIAEAAQHAAAALAQMQAAKKCEDDVKGLATASVDECKKNPNNPLCIDSQRCSNPEFAATNKVCMCINNPNSKDCIAETGAIGSRGVAGGDPFGRVDGSSSSQTDAGVAQIGSLAATAGENPLAASLRDGAVKNEQNLGGAKGNAGLGGSGGGGGSSAGMGSSYGGGGAGSEDDRTKVNSGFYGGASGSGGYFGRTNGALGGSGGRANAGGVNYNKMAGGAQFDPRRYIAGLNGKGGEYINGPNLDIFKIVKNRIEAKKPTMLDPDFKK